MKSKATTIVTHKSFKKILKLIKKPNKITKAMKKLVYERKP